MTSEIFSANFSLWVCAWQSTIFLVAGLLGSFLLWRHSARAHQVLLLSMIAAVIAPVASALVKRYELGVFAAKPPVIESPSERWVTSDSRGATGIVATEDVERDPASVSEVTSLSVSVSRAAKFPWRFVLLCGWVAANSILAVRLLASFILGVRLLGRAMPLSCDRIEHALNLAKVKLEISRDVQIRSSREVCSPVIWCWRRRPALLVPSAAGQGDSRIDWTGVLCHELAHWKRRDHISGLLGELAVCILPWHPLLWWAKSRLIALSEQACDDWVLATGHLSTNYAESLLDLAPGGQMAFVPAVVSSKKALAGRVRRILEERCASPRSGLCWSVAVTLVAGCVAVGMAFGQTRPSEPSGTIKTKVSQSAVIERPAFPVTVIKGRIVDPNGETAYDARIVALPATSYSDSIQRNNKEGSFELPWSPAWIKEGQPIYVMAVSSWQRSEAALVELHDPTSPMTVRLEPAFSLEGKVVDPNGHRIAKYSAILSLPGGFKCQTPIFATAVGVPRVRIFSPIPYGPQYKLTVQAEGYQTKELTVDGTDRSKKVIDIGTIALQPQGQAKAVVEERGSDPDLAEEFHKIYRLEAGEIVKFIKAPFVLGRQEYLHTVGYGPDAGLQPVGLQHGPAWQTGFQWDGQLKTHSGYGSDSPRLWWVLRLVLDIQEYDFEIPTGLNVPLPYGDWIVRAGSPLAEQFGALEEILHAELNRAIHFEKRTVEREVIVAIGRYEFKAHPSGDYPDYIPVTSESAGEITKTAAIKTADSLSEFLRYLESSLEIKVVDETERIENTTIRYRGSGSRLGWMTDTEQRNETLGVLLDNLTKTTSLQFKVERRPAEIWVVTEGKGT